MNTWIQKVIQLSMEKQHTTVIKQNYCTVSKGDQRWRVFQQNAVDHQPHTANTFA